MRETAAIAHMFVAKWMISARRDFDWIIIETQSAQQVGHAGAAGLNRPAARTDSDGSFLLEWQRNTGTFTPTWMRSLRDGSVGEVAAPLLRFQSPLFR